MILRRVINHFRKQEWTAIFLDFVIVVLGVFVGMQVSNWNAARIDKTREIEYLHALQRDLEESLAFAEDTIESLDRTRAAQAALADHIQGIRQLDLGALDEAIFRGLYPLSKLDVSMSTYDELKTSGATSFLKDRALRFALQELDSRRERVREAEADKSEVFYRFSDPYLIANFNLNTKAFLRTDRDGSRPSVYVRQDEFQNPDEALNTEEFKNILIYRYNADGNQLQSIRELREQYVKIEQIVRARLDKLGAADR